MARTKLALEDLAVDVLRAVEREELGKTASSSYTSSISTEVGAKMVKLAKAIRENKPAPISYNDVVEFRKRYGV